MILQLKVNIVVLFFIRTILLNSSSSDSRPLPDIEFFLHTYLDVYLDFKK